jgi:hypothetical protein
MHTFRRFLGAAAVLIVVCTEAYAAQATSVSQWGITWTFDRSHEVGQYANGDYWVVGPVNITAISPASTVAGGRVINGTEVNPQGGNSQGYDSHQSDMQFSSSRNVAPGATGRSLQVTTGSVVSSVSLDNPDDQGRPLLRSLAILTVVSAPPPAGSFRPSPYGTDKTSRWRESDLDYSVLRTLPAVADTPSLSSVTDSVRRFWNEQNTHWSARAVHASQNQPEYGRDMANTLALALLSLHLDYSREQKRDLFVYIVQLGLDVYGSAQIGGVWLDLGGHNHGRKMPMLLAGLALNDPNILRVADAARSMIFQEDRQTFFVSQADVDRELYQADGDDRKPYTSDMIGMPEWGEQHTRQPNRDSSGWGADYRWVGSGFMGHALMAHLTPGAVDAWNWPAFFEYTDRYESISGTTTGTNGVKPFVRSMWTAYRQSGDGGVRSTRPMPPQLSIE